MHDKELIFRSISMIEERIAEKLTVEAIAESIHLSKYHYQRMFREAVGDSVMGYVARRRMALAAEELAGTDSTVLTVALKYGYDSHEGFTRGFKACMGVTPTEYRKHHLPMPSGKRKKEESAMLYSKTTDEMIRELNILTVEAEGTAAYIRKHGGDVPEAPYYGQFWEFAAHRAERMAEQLRGQTERVAAIAGQPDGIGARFLIMKTIEDAAFEASITAFQTGLTIARAMPEHREIFRPLCAKYDDLAGHARIGAGKLAAFFRELAVLIFQDMRENGRQRIDRAAAAGRKAAEALRNPALPYGYIAEEIWEMAETLSAMDLEEMTAGLLEDYGFRLEAVAFAAEVDALRNPADRLLFNGIKDFQERIDEALEFCRSLPAEAARDIAEPEDSPAWERTEGKMYSDLAMQESLLLFSLKGEIQKLGTHLEDERKGALEAICGKMGRAIGLAGHAACAAEGAEVGKLLREACEELSAEAQRLGLYGGALQYIAQEAAGPLKYLTACEG